MNVPAGTKFGPYEVVAPLGAGGMGEVYRARDPRLGRDVAIKVLPASFSSDPDRLKRFEQEARAAGVLNHPNLTIVYDIGTQDGAPYVVQELLEGQTLRSELAGGRFSPRKAVDYAIQVAQGLAAAHGKGIVHRDLKPENLFVTREGRIKILDFGLAKLTQVEGSGSVSKLPTATEPGVVMGTLGYLSPEQIKTEPADGRSDIFALGVILHEMLSGERPFRGNSSAETMAAILKEDPPELSATNRDISPGLERLVRHCLEKTPERRFQSASDLAYALESLSTTSGAVTAARPLAAPSLAWRKSLIVAAPLLAAGLLAGWFLHASRQEPSAPPSYKRLTFRRGTVFTARFAPDGQTVVYSGSWEGEPARIHATRSGSVESRALQIGDARVLAVSPTGELAIQLGRETVWDTLGTLARVPLEGGAPRELLENVIAADWSPDGRDLAVVHRVDGKDRLEFPIGEVLHESPDAISSVRFSPRGDRLAIARWDGTIATVDLSGRVTTLSKGWGPGIGNVAWRPDGSEIWFSGLKGSEQFALYAVTLSGLERLVRREAAGLFLHDISRDGRVLLNNYLWDSSLVALPAGESVERELSWMDQPLAVAISNDGRAVIFDEWGEGGGANGSVYFRAADGSAPVRLGEGEGYALSSDGRWVLSQPSGSPETFVLLPTGPGRPRPVEHRGITTCCFAGFLPDGKRIVFLGRTEKESLRLYIQDLDAGQPRAISPEGIAQVAVSVSPDGRFVAALAPDSTLTLYPIDGGASRPLAGGEMGERPISWSADGRSVYAYRRRESPARIFKIDVATGKRELWKTIAPTDRAGFITIDSIVMTPDARAYAYSFQRVLTNLKVVEGLK
jgi:Tol biopolymer transport system component